MNDTLLNQDEIDSLLNQINNENNSDTENKENENQLKTYKKIFRPLKKSVEKFQFPRRSPIIKKENVVLNPEPSYIPKKNETVVYTLDGYIKRRYK
ncbi:hypothetical protein DRQ09_01815 [candidate division KSB1 bacterium]|nr:MAG: hypothetical protein DRQ09_01815 [candidate division KSB1 bacterium]